MKRSLLAVTGIGALLSGACVPLSQAPLVYSSKVQDGVNVAAATPENPGVELNIGLNAVDAAYVPVATARACESARPSECSSDSYNVDQVRGSNIQANSENPSEQALVDANQRVDRLRTEINNIDTRISTAASTNQALTAERETLNRLAAAPPPVAPAPAPTGEDGAPAVDPNAAAAAAAAAQAATARTQRIEAIGREINAGTETVQNLRTESTNRNAELALAITNQQRILTVLNRNRADNKTDALSVFGSFNGDATAGGGANATAGLQFGKVFSTGVAAQNLTQGISAASRATGLAQCYNAAAAAGSRAPEPNREATIRDLAARCAALSEP